MFKKVLVANRGEIAVRIIRTLREMAITSVAIYSKADSHAYHTNLADEAICVGSERSTDSYTNMMNILSAALLLGCDAIHPGYGFLSEKSEFVHLCEEVGIKFIGPSSQIIDLMGHKQHARQCMLAAGVSVIPGSSDLVTSLEEAQTIADEVGYPIMLKAVDGGGGKGIRLVKQASELETLFRQVQSECQSVYGNQDIYIEKVISPARHIEVQILGDHQGHVIHLGERECSLQRKHQKVIEMAPAQGLKDRTIQDLRQQAVTAAQAIGYENAGTIEFLVDSQERFYFLEMNTRLQVEHPITEMITGVDIVEQQIRIAAGKALNFSQDEIKIEGFAMECRLNAENPQTDFSPNAGTISQLILPSGGLGLRVETGLYTHCQVPPYYDSMIAKIVTHRSDRQSCFTLMKRALFEVVVEGLVTNIDFLEALIQESTVIRGDYDTQWIEREFMDNWLHE